MEKVYSYHVFLFPFKWYDTTNKENELLDKESLKRLTIQRFSNWIKSNPVSEKEKEELYNEKNYFYQFVHEVLYDTEENSEDPVMRHFEHKSTTNQDVYYNISLKGGKKYTLKIDAINLNFYSTGVGTLSFYLVNNNALQKEKEDILKINQYGRRIMPPFFADINFRFEIAEYLSITGLNGVDDRYKEDFSAYTPTDTWIPAKFITELITDFNSNLKIKSVVDDRMFVLCWYGSDSLSDYIKKDIRSFVKDDFWYKFCFIDANSATCQNEEMQKQLIDNHSYFRWQKAGTMSGVTGYSLVMLSDESEDFSIPVLQSHIRTIYARMIELALVQRSSMLRFSEEVCRLSKLKNTTKNPVVEEISDLNREYIRFANQIYFRDVTSQDQGIEFYEMIMKSMRVPDYVKDLDNEIGELHQYATLIEDRNRSKEARTLNWIATIFLPASFLSSIFGMNYLPVKGYEIQLSFWMEIVICILASLMTWGLIRLFGRKRKR